MSCTQARGRGPLPTQDPRAAPHGNHRGVAPATDSPADTTPHDTTPVNNNRMAGRQMSCHEQTAPALCDAAKMSPHISIGPEPVLATHAPSPTAAGSHDLSGKTQVPLQNRVFWDSELSRGTLWMFTTMTNRMCTVSDSEFSTTVNHTSSTRRDTRELRSSGFKQVDPTVLMYDTWIP